MERGGYEICCMQLVAAPPQGPFLDTWAHPGAGRRRENQLRELILYPALCCPTLSPAPRHGPPGERRALWDSQATDQIHAKGRTSDLEDWGSGLSGLRGLSS